MVDDALADFAIRELSRDHFKAVDPRRKTGRSSLVRQYETIRYEVSGGVGRLTLAANIPITGWIIYTAATDPNRQIGRPGGYLSRVALVDRRIPR